jgi:hypothetical protein
MTGRTPCRDGKSGVVEAYGEAGCERPATYSRQQNGRAGGTRRAWVHEDELKLKLRPLESKAFREATAFCNAKAFVEAMAFE